MSKKITKAVFPVAGLGTRFLPATKGIPKEMLPIVDKPLIQYAVEEAVAAGIDTMVFITGRSKNAITDHFDKAYELEKELESKNKTEILKLIQDIVPPHVSCIFIRQSEALGLGHAVYCARPVIGDEPFAVILADDLIEDAGRGCMAQMVKLYEQKHTSILGVERVDPSETGSYGIVKTADFSEKSAPIEIIVEKPKPEDAPSDLAVVGRYILTPAIFDKIKKTGRGAGGEIQLTDAIADLLNDEPVLAYEFEGTRYDCGSKLGFLIANVELALLNRELKDGFLAYLKELTKKYKM
ncbi:UTP--glucose-1-phosphate uridylyltransferase GalU [Methylobacter sp. S3L5C]|uniref:UTP--glucose-1-phosphate uridylyltransferase GalU n=1 Tax=Methylobacter sp. S3L5C TaxID=2839024 RepID=UPI001FACDC74|nr:UTP--glucose-1-phosphate uridylyltransferase GalU [Methylobacter sp. S3L5C]UOA08175.1 UTP--glucose-1-phosphate uridylyltransferase GalU [Methylobacter sp. S3L5C]